MTERIIEMIQSGNKEHPLVKSYIEGSRFYSDFIDMMKFFENKLKKGYFYFEKGIDIFGTISRAFLSYQNNLDKTNANLYSNEEGNTGFEYIQFKELDLRICSTFLQSLEH